MGVPALRHSLAGQGLSGQLRLRRLPLWGAPLSSRDRAALLLSPTHRVPSEPRRVAFQNRSLSLQTPP